MAQLPEFWKIERDYQPKEYVYAFSSIKPKQLVSVPLSYDKHRTLKNVKKLIQSKIEEKLKEDMVNLQLALYGQVVYFGSNEKKWRKYYYMKIHGQMR